MMFVVFTLVLAAMHWLVWRTSTQRLDLPISWHKPLAVILLLLYVGLITIFFVFRLLPFGTVRWWTFFIFVWLGLLFYFCVVIGVLELFRAVLRLPQRRTLSNPARRTFLARVAGGAVMAGAVPLTSRSLNAAMSIDAVAIKQVNVALPRWPVQLNGFRIVQITDLHIGCILDGKWLEQIVDRVNSMRPDLIAITGDLVDGSVPQLRAQVEPIAKLRSRFGSYFCTGNHEYYSGAVAWCAEVTRLGVRVLRNECVAIGEGDALFDLAGIDDFKSAGRAPGHGPNLPAAMTQHHPDREIILLAHQPRAIDEAAALGISLQLSGHTHGGQIWPFHYVVRLSQPYLSGLHQQGSTQIYVSEGTGFWGPPMRFGSTAEITEITLSRGNR